MTFLVFLGIIFAWAPFTEPRPAGHSSGGQVAAAPAIHRHPVRRAIDDGSGILTRAGV